MSAGKGREIWAVESASADGVNQRKRERHIHQALSLLRRGKGGDKGARRVEGGTRRSETHGVGRERERRETQEGGDR